MDRIQVTKKFLPIFCLIYIVSFVILPLVCLTEEIVPPEGGHSSCSPQTNHSPPAAKNKLPCPNNHSCCNFIASNEANYFFTLSSSQITPIEISFQSLEITGFVFRPPETQV